MAGVGFSIVERFEKTGFIFPLDFALYHAAYMFHVFNYRKGIDYELAIIVANNP